MSREAVILAGGFGTRLQSMVSDVPKPMALINNIPFLAYLLEELQNFQFEKVIFAAGFKYEIIESYFGSSYKNITLLYSIENEPLGTGGAITEAASLVSSEYFFVLNGDTYFELSYDDMAEKFEKSRSGLMVALKPKINFDRYGCVVVGGDRIVSFEEKKFCREGLINGGIYIVDTGWLKRSTPAKVFSFEKDILEKQAGKDKITHFISDGYFIDIGIPEDYIKASTELPLLIKM